MHATSEILPKTENMRLQTFSQKQNANLKKSEIVGTKTGLELKISVRKIYLGRISNEMSTEEVEKKTKKLENSFLEF